MDFGDLRKKNKGEYISIPPTKEIPEEGFRWMSNDEWDASVPQKTYFFLAGFLNVKFWFVSPSLIVAEALRVFHSFVSLSLNFSCQAMTS